MRVLAMALASACMAAVAVAKDAMPAGQPDGAAASQPIGTAKPVTTTIIKTCPDGYELVIRTGGRHGCARDILPANE